MFLCAAAVGENKLFLVSVLDCARPFTERDEKGSDFSISCECVGIFPY